MRLPHWLRSLVARPNRTPARRAPRRPTCRPRVEALEDRTAPAVFTVTTTADSGVGSLRQAILDASATPGADSIVFALPDSLKSPGGWWTIQPLTALPALTDAVSIDGWSQAGAGRGLAPRVVIDGTQAGSVNGLHFTGDSTIRGLAIDNFNQNGHAGIVLDGGSNTVQGCYVGLDPTGTTAAPNVEGIADMYGSIIGGPNPGDGNVISGNLDQNIASRGYGVTIRGNFIGTNAAGTAAVGASIGIAMGFTPTNYSGAVIENNLISGNAGGPGIELSQTSHVQITGNLIGTDVTGMYAIGNGGPGGIWVGSGVSDLIIGGTDAASRNVISANSGHGIRIDSNGVIVQGNYIGTDVTGAADLGNGGAGIEVVRGSLVGGPEPGAGNLIAGNFTDGNLVDTFNALVEGNVIRDNYHAGIEIGPEGLGSGNTVTRNAIYGNTPNPFVPNHGSGLGIDILTSNSDSGGVTLNDSAGHAGPNHLQNFPVLTAVTVHAGGGATVTGTFSEAAEPNTTLQLEFFANQAADPSGYGQGQRYIGSVNVTTDAAGNASFTAPLAALLSGEQVFSATATNLATGDTSEFCADLSIPSVGPITAPLAPVAVNTAVNASASFTDPLTTATHTALWDWGDGTTSAGGVAEANGSGSVSGSHTYTADGVYTITLTVTNNGGGSGQSVFSYMVVYDPSAGFVTGGGWFTSPAGAYAANPALTGKANFGLNAKYHKGSTVPTGETEFQFPAAGLDFHATSYDWLVVTTNQAQYQGSGTINGTGNYGFLVTAQDNGGHGSDLVRIQIWDKGNNNAVVYDTQPGAPTNSAPTTALGGGRIQVHTNAQLAAGGENPSGGSADPLTPDELRPIVQEAIARWQEAGISPAQANYLRQVTVGVAEFPGPWLGMAFPGAVWFDRTAAGYGWYLDPTPADDSEFPASPGGPAYGKMDLLTVVEHELGHELGYEDTAGSGLMGVFLGTGERRVPSLHEQAGQSVGSAPASSTVSAALPLTGPDTSGVLPRLLPEDDEGVWAAFADLGSGLVNGSSVAPLPVAGGTGDAAPLAAPLTAGTEGNAPVIAGAGRSAPAAAAVDGAQVEDSYDVFGDPLALTLQGL
jgi:hypothetical protein